MQEREGLEGARGLEEEGWGRSEEVEEEAARWGEGVWLEVGEAMAGEPAGRKRRLGTGTLT